jgi:hypothetical protein
MFFYYVTGGIIYDVIVEPPSVGSTTDEHGHTRYNLPLREVPGPPASEGNPGPVHCPV